MENALFNSRLVLASAFSVAVYEQAMSFPDELASVWRSKQWSTAKAAFVVNRYCAILGMAMYMIWMYTSFSHSTCDKNHWLPYAVSLASLLAGDYILGVRVYAVWEKSKLVAAGLFAMMAICFAADLWTLHRSRPLPVPAGEKGCVTLPGPGENAYAFVPWAVCSLYEVICLALVIVRSMRYKRQGAVDSPLVDLIVKDGCYYFIAVATCKIAATLNYIFNQSNPSLLVPFTAVVASIMCSRLFFRMCVQANAPSTLNSRTSRSWRSPYGTKTVTATEGSLHKQSVRPLPVIEEKSSMPEYELSCTSFLEVEQGDSRDVRLA